MQEERKITVEYASSLVKRIQRANENMMRLVSGLLNYAKIQSGTFTLEKTRFSVADLFHELKDIFEPLAEKKGIKITFQTSQDLSFLADPSLLSQAMGNLIGNALKFTPPEGRIEVCAKKDNGLLLEVKDSGSGVPQEIQEKIFHRYWQPDNSKTQGAGLGLFIVKGITDAHQGKVWVESIPGQGSRFKIFLPETNASDAGISPPKKIESNQAPTIG
jgi:signal transduction histidine kinase